MRRSLRAEIVPYGAYEAVDVAAGRGRPVQIPVERPRKRPAAARRTARERAARWSRAS